MFSIIPISIVVLPQPVGPTIATFWPCFIVRLKSVINCCSFTYENSTCLNSTLSIGSTISLVPSSTSFGSSNRVTTLLKEANADCTSLITPEISLKGLVYWFAYDKNEDNWPIWKPTGLMITKIAPTIPTKAYTNPLTNLVLGLVVDETNWALTPTLYKSWFIFLNSSIALSS